MLSRLFDPLRPLSLAPVYGFFAAVMIVLCAVVTPPGQTPDEQNHFARAAQIAQGGWVGLRTSPRDSGGYLPSNVPRVMGPFDDLRFDARRKVSVPLLNGVAGLPWDDRRPFFNFGNTVIYAPVTYLPGAATIAVARATRMTVLQTSYAVRIVNGIVALVLATLGIALARRGAVYLAVMAGLPMVMALAASCSQDGILVGLAVLLAGVLSRIEPREQVSPRLWIGVAIGFAILSVSKPPLIWCAAIPLAFGARGHRLISAAPLLLSAVVVVFWQRVGIAPVKIQFLPDSGVSDAGQMHWVLTHPTAIPALAFHTLRQTLHARVLEFIGVLGWLDTPLPKGFYRLSYGVIAAALALSCVALRERTALRPTRLCMVLTLGTMALASGSVFLSLYVIWTKVGGPVVEGVQGRYFLPIAPFLALVFPRTRQPGRVCASLLVHQLAVIGVAVFLFVTTLTVGTTLAGRYW
ncbi:hypothetical protein AA103196_0394 [Ameyamaea chiangmaiensis NBRC 103196]|uniref:DUF2142 domain-containing protein n=1 Tax=Ameyamaea chiangmaiensis TaxID=442969 RepID=A0A850PC97_9PROT|nr:DUF2142 domain-containing protein [Ameyamaea chiangmaiensis]MBS4074790.1 DUF2142 domain-containing protein [Ameyamaea chiangmaiensis]NVN41578.1 DUF2142 domain-containing protein [Ameyamaea chiangmaiensis]GBQ62747.1 hypothetical protein AA103196_0394 [Ameyamaea chiangmaiensis NBRC 103196]